MVQGFQPRAAAEKVFKYVGITGADQARLVQVRIEGNHTLTRRTPMSGCRPFRDLTKDFSRQRHQRIAALTRQIHDGGPIIPQPNEDQPFTGCKVITRTYGGDPGDAG